MKVADTEKSDSSLIKEKSKLLLDRIKTKSQKNNVNDALNFSIKMHHGQKRKSGLPYVSHCIDVANKLIDWKMDHTTVISALLHDVVEDTRIDLSEIEANFGLEVKILVEGVTKLGGIHFNNRTEAQAENLRKMFLAMASDIRVVLVKLADRLHNMRTIEWLNDERKQRIARETREIYAPLANRLGINRFKWELEDLAFKFLEPKEFQDLKDQIVVKRSDREKRLKVTINLMKENLVSAGLKNFEITGRPKHLYGIWSKMQRQQKQFHEILSLIHI